ncbi:MAG: HIT domain-containing protein [Anaerolineae bacterium]|nr:HIT domain-containing protein [Phycisphaerae bacterium]
MSSHLQAPWRMQYIRGLSNPESAEECFLCAAARATSEDERRARLVLWTTEHSVVVINLFPYTNGHLLISPKSHKADMEELTEPELLDIQRQTVAAITLLKRAISPQGFNIGINLGRCAGAGLPGHVHQHVVPRWAGDVNFMTVVGDVRVVPEAADKLWEELTRVRREIGTADARG